MSKRMTFEVTGMSCDGCEENVETAIEDLHGVESAEADHEAGTVEVVADDDQTEEHIETAMHNSGYEIVG